MIINKITEYINLYIFGYIIFIYLYICLLITKIHGGYRRRKKYSYIFYKIY